MKKFCKGHKVSINEYIVEVVGNSVHEYLAGYPEVPIPKDIQITMPFNSRAPV